jgi:hypothetical protein
VSAYRSTAPQLPGAQRILQLLTVMSRQSAIEQPRPDGVVQDDLVRRVDVEALAGTKLLDQLLSQLGVACVRSPGSI